MVYIQLVQTHWLFLKGHKKCLFQWTIIIQSIINYIFLYILGLLSNSVGFEISTYTSGVYKNTERLLPLDITSHLRQDDHQC